MHYASHIVINFRNIKKPISVLRGNPSLMKKFLLLCAVLIGTDQTVLAQEEKQNYNTEGGKLMLGVRSTVSAFSDDGSNGMGVGGQFRLRLLKQLNTEWFADYIKSNIDDLGRRTDAHIGWSVMFYALDQDKNFKVNPYLLGGHCFDYTKVRTNRLGDSRDRWSSAVHLGAGTHFQLSRRADLSLSSQYMIHLGKDIETERYKNIYGAEDLRIVEGELGLEGHLFIALSVNILVADLW